ARRCGFHQGTDAVLVAGFVLPALQREPLPPSPPPSLLLDGEGERRAPVAVFGPRIRVGSAFQQARRDGVVTFVQRHQQRCPPGGAVHVLRGAVDLRTPL